MQKNWEKRALNITKRNGWGKKTAACLSDSVPDCWGHKR
ncbi:hypothetical protein T4A_5546 [Trichinella pseudospiralis]|uniref:Uncharacterized protein n=1 Tax=Trichinella pseudospiralis TaxID=6337 RepID=A0A0V1DJM6_TRIPS|nr:hypothetical protein T4A_5546 [Trichinella pseudospiralis]